MLIATMEVDLVARAAINRDIAELNRVRSELQRQQQVEETQLRIEARVTTERLAEEEQRIISQVRDIREDRRALVDDQRRVVSQDTDAADIRRESRLDLIDDDIRAAIAEARANGDTDLDPVVRDGQVVVEAAPQPRGDAALAGQDLLNADRVFQDLRARDQRLVERAADERDFQRQQEIEQARSESNIRQTTQPDAEAPRGALVDLQA